MPFAPLWLTLTDAWTGRSSLVFEDMRDTNASSSWPDPSTVLDAYNRALPAGLSHLDSDDLFIGHLANADIPIHLWREGVPHDRWLPSLKTWLSAAKDRGR